MMQPLAILGGTFDPVHNAHLRVAWEAAERLDAEVRLIPANVPPHRDQPVASARERAAILRAALAGQDRLVLDERELRREGPSWTIDTLIELRDEIGAERPLVLLVGADAFLGLPSWHRWGEMFDYAHIGVLTRPGHEIATLPTELRIKVASRRTNDPAALRADAVRPRAADACHAARDFGDVDSRRARGRRRAALSHAGFRHRGSAPARAVSALRRARIAAVGNDWPYAEGPRKVGLAGTNESPR